jgi:hypothetical protein
VAPGVPDVDEAPETCGSACSLSRSDPLESLLGQPPSEAMTRPREPMKMWRFISEPPQDAADICAARSQNLDWTWVGTGVRQPFHIGKYGKRCAKLGRFFLRHPHYRTFITVFKFLNAHRFSSDGRKGPQFAMMAARPVMKNWSDEQVKSMKVGQTAFVPGWLVGQGLCVLEGVVVVRRGRQGVVRTTVRWTLGDDGRTRQEAWKDTLTLQLTHLQFSLWYLLQFMREAHVRVDHPSKPDDTPEKIRLTSA